MQIICVGFYSPIVNIYMACYNYNVNERTPLSDLYGYLYGADISIEHTDCRKSLTDTYG